jgi:hypothetical protein
MTMHSSLARTSALTGFLLLTATAAHGATQGKEECLEAHGNGQDAREAGQFARAGKLFLTCAQPTCPTLVQSDCARFADELARLQPTVTFAARDGAQRDLPETSVFMDGALVASRLGDGRAYEIDPGPHEVRFVHAGKEIVLDVVVNEGEKGRGIVGAFPSPPTAPRAQQPAPATPPAPAPVVSSAAPARAIERKRPAGPLVLVGLGASAMVAGGVIVGVGLSGIPARCSLWTSECAAVPEDPVFEEASRGVKTANVGGVVAGLGVMTLASSLIWYLGQPLRPATPTTAGFLPWVGLESAGLAWEGAL